MKGVRSVGAHRNLLKVRAEFIDGAQLLFRYRSSNPENQRYIAAEKRRTIRGGGEFLYFGQTFKCLSFTQLLEGAEITGTNGIYSRFFHADARNLAVGLTEKAGTIVGTIIDPLAKLLVCELDISYQNLNQALSSLLDNEMPRLISAPVQRSHIESLLEKLENLSVRIKDDGNEILNKNFPVDGSWVHSLNMCQLILDSSRSFRNYTSLDNVEALDKLLGTATEHENYSKMLGNVVAFLQHSLAPAYVTTPLAWGIEMYRSQGQGHPFPNTDKLDGFPERPISFREVQNNAPYDEMFRLRMERLRIAFLRFEELKGQNA